MKMIDERESQKQKTNQKQRQKRTRGTRVIVKG